MAATAEREDHVLGRVHIYEADRAGGRPRLVRIEPERWVSRGTPAGTERYCVTWDGRWWGTGGEPLDPDIVPEWAKAEVERTGLPTAHLDQGPEIVSTCEICGERMHSTHLNAHLLAHYREREALEAAAAERPRRRGES